MFDRRQRGNPRWQEIRCYGLFTPSYSESSWSAHYVGLLDLGRLHEVRFLDAVERLASIRVRPFDALDQPEICQQIFNPLAQLDGLRTCKEDHIAEWFNALDICGGFKALSFRRGAKKP
jgi:hypothetical protein